MAKVSVNYDNLPKGKVVEITGLGQFKNGETSDVDDRRWERFKRQNNYEGDSLTVGTQQAREATEALRTASEADLDDAKKDELVDAAGAVGVDQPSGKTKDELKQELKDRREQ